MSVSSPKKNSVNRDSSVTDDRVQICLPGSLWQPRFGFSGSTLKLFAIITMLIDHTGASVLAALISYYRTHGTAAQVAQMQRLYTTSRSIGRLAFPIFCFLIVEGYFHTRSVRKYAERLFFFALISEIPFDFALKPEVFYPMKQNVYFTLLIGLLSIWAVDMLKGRYLLQSVAMAAGMMAARGLLTDYGFKGVILIESLYLFHDIRLFQSIAGAVMISWEQYAPLSYILTFFYNGKRGLRLKYLFYFFYPVHLIILGIIERVIRAA